METRELALRLRDLVGGVPQVVEYWDSAYDQVVHVFSSTDRPERGLTTWATIGMSRFDNQLLTGDGRDLRVELLSVCGSAFPTMGNVLASCAFNVASGQFAASPDVIFPAAGRVNDPSVRMKHALLTTPFLWDLPADVETDRVTSWLQVVPVDDTEFDFAREHGVAALRERFLLSQPDVFDLDRPTAL